MGSRPVPPALGSPITLLVGGFSKPVKKWLLESQGRFIGGNVLRSFFEEAGTDPHESPLEGFLQALRPTRKCTQSFLDTRQVGD